MNTKQHTNRRLLQVGVPLVVLSLGISALTGAGKSEFPETKALPDQGYAGDGTFTAREGKTSATHYTVNLGAIDLTTSERHEFTLSGLPAVRFTTGLALDLLHPFDDPARPADAKPDWFDKVTVKMSLTDTESGTTVFTFERPLSEYTWTNVGPEPNWSQLYNRGDFRPDDEKSIFTAGENTNYSLVVEVTSKADAAVPAVLLLQGGCSKVQ